MERIAVFRIDPFTRGHESIVNRVLPLFDSDNCDRVTHKQYYFPLEKLWIEKTFAGNKCLWTVSAD